MTIHRTGTMSRRGTHARDTGSTTGIATAVLALLSAGTLASLGLVTADGLRGGSNGSLSAPYNDLLPPVDVVVTPTPRTPGPSSQGGGGGGSRPVLGPFVPAAVTGGVDGSGPTLATSGPGEAEVPSLTVVTAPPVPSGPVFSALDPTPAPSVLAVKHGRAVGHTHAPGQAHKATKQPHDDNGTVTASATPTSPTFLGVTPAVTGDEQARPEHGRLAHANAGHPGSGPGRAAQQQPVAATDPALPAAAPAPVCPAVAPTADPTGSGKGHGHAYGHDQA